MLCYEIEQNEGSSNFIAVIFARWCTLPITDKELPSSLPQGVVKQGLMIFSKIYWHFGVIFLALNGCVKQPLFLM